MYEYQALTFLPQSVERRQTNGGHAGRNHEYRVRYIIIVNMYPCICDNHYSRFANHQRVRLPLNPGAERSGSKFQADITHGLLVAGGFNVQVAPWGSHPLLLRVSFASLPSYFEVPTDMAGVMKNNCCFMILQATAPDARA